MVTTPSVGSFVSIAESLQRRLVKTWTKQVTPLVRDIQQAVEDDDLPEARELAKTVDFAPVFDDNVGFITFMMTASILFGAASISSVEDNQFVGKALPDLFDITRDQLEGMLKIAFAETVRRRIICEIEKGENKQQ